MNDMTKEWSKTTKHVEIHVFSGQGWSDSLMEDFAYDLNLVTFAIILVGIYTMFMLGNCSPMHCRCLVALTGLICVLLSYAAGFGFMFICGA